MNPPIFPREYSNTPEVLPILNTPSEAIANNMPNQEIIAQLPTEIQAEHLDLSSAAVSPIGSLAIAASMGIAAAKLRTGRRRHWRAYKADMQADRLERQPTTTTRLQTIKANAAKANIDSMLPKDSRSTAKPIHQKKRKDRILQSNPGLQPLERVGLVNFGTGKIIDGSAHHFGTRTPGSFTEARIVAAKLTEENRENPTANPPKFVEPTIEEPFITPTASPDARTNREVRAVKKLNIIRDEITNLNHRIQKHQTGPYGDMLGDDTRVEEYMSETDLTPKQKTSIRHRHEDVKQMIEKATGLNNYLSDISSGNDSSTKRRLAKAARKRAKAQKLRQKAIK